MERYPRNTERTVSVVIPAYQCGDRLPEAIDSVLRQSYPDCEILVVDDGSTDGTKAKLEPFIKGSLIRYHRQENRGPAAARNAGIALARGGYIAFLDADDVWHPQKLERSITFLEERGFDWICTAMEKISKSGERFVKRISPDSWVLDPGTGRVRQLRKGLFYFSSIPVHCQTVLARKTCFETAGVFDENLRVGEDTDLFLRFEEAGLKGGYLDEPLTTYRYNPSGITHGRGVDGVRECVRLAKKHLAILGKHDPQVRRSYGDFLWEVSRVYYAKKNYPAAARYFLLSLRYRPETLARAAAGFRKRFRRVSPTGGKMNVLYYDPSSGFGGSSRCLASWLDRLDRERFTPFVAAHYDGPAIRRIREAGVRVVNIPFRSFFLYNTKDVARYPRAAAYLMAVFNLIAYDIPTAMHVYHAIKKYRIDVVHLNAPVTSTIGGIIASRFAGVPCICHLHDTKPIVRKERFFSRWVDRLVVLTPRAMELYGGQYPGIPIDLIPNGVGTADLQPGPAAGMRRKYGIGREESVAGIVGRLVPGKGFDDFIRAAAMIAPRLPKTVFMIVGDDPMEGKEYEERLRALVRKNALEKRVIFAGWQEKAIEFIASFDVLVQASSTFPEGFGMTVIEAMALSKPVIVTNIPGPSEIVVDGVTGLIVPPADPRRMAEALKRLLTDARLARTMGANGRQRVEEYYNLDATVRKIEASYGSLRDRKASFASLEAAYSNTRDIGSPGGSRGRNADVAAGGRGSEGASGSFRRSSTG